MPLNLLGVFSDPTIVLDERARVVGMNSAAGRVLALSNGNAIGKPCFEVIGATDATTGRPCRVDCAIARRIADGWMHTRCLTGLRGPMREARCLLLRTAIHGAPATLVVIESNPGPSRADAALAAEITAKTLPALLTVNDANQAALVVLGSALRLTAGDAAEAAFAFNGKGPLVRSASIGDPEAPGTRAHAGEHNRQRDELSLQARRLVISAGQTPDVPPNGDGASWALTAPIHYDSRLAGSITVAGKPPAFSISQSARILCALADLLGLYLRWLPRPGEGAHLRIRTLGGFSVEVDGNSRGSPTFRRRSGLNVVKLLVAAEGHSLPRSDLAALLWPSGSTGRAAGNLRAVLHSLRRDLEPKLPAGEPSTFIYADRHRVGLRKSRVWVDVHEFTRARASFLDLSRLGYRQEAVRAGQLALGLYAGPYLGDECRDDRSLAERTRLHELYIDLTMRVGRALIAIEEPEAAEHVYRRALVLEPAREEVHAELTRLLIDAGRPREARQQLRTCVRAMRAVLGTHPSAETLSLVREIALRRPPAGPRAI